MLQFLHRLTELFSWYDLMAALGLCAALGYAIHRLSAAGETEALISRVTWITLAAFALGGAASNVFNWFVFPEKLALPLLARIASAGLTFYPGMICAIGAGVLLYRLFGLPAGRILCHTTAAYPLFHGIARIGCLLCGCCYGREITVGSFNFRFPSQAVEAAFLLGLFAFLHVRRPGRPLPIYAMCYSVFRFFAEFLRGDDRGVLIPGCPLSPSQQISLAVFAAGLLYYTVRRIKTHLPARKEGTRS